ncbi:MAG: DedA family protein [Chloroflexi bacterium]|nr:DedA family protein [Chloroflexota bacterium]
MIDILLGYAALFAWSFLAATVLPLSSEAALAALVHVQQQIALPVLIATLGNYLGACTTYWLAAQAAKKLDQRQEPRKGQERAARLLRRYGPPVLLLSWVPLLGDALVALAGALSMPFKLFSLWVILGKSARYLAIAWLAAAL